MGTFLCASRSRIAFVVTVAIVVASVLAVGSIFTGQAVHFTLAHGETMSEVNQKLAALKIKRHAAEFISEKAARVRKALKDGDFTVARRIVGDVMANSHLGNWRYYPFDDFVTSITRVNDPALEPRLDAWVAQDRNDAIPLLVRALYEHDMGWFKRGTRFTREVQPDHMASFVNYMNKASGDIDSVLQSDNGGPYAFYLKLRIMRGLGAIPEMKTTFEAATAKYPEYYPLYEMILAMLQPKWGGTVKAMYAFVDEYAGQAAEHSPLKLLYLSLYRNLLDSAAVTCLSNRQDADARSECISSVMQEIVTPDLRKQVVSALQLYDHSDKHEFGLAVERILLDALRTSGGDAYSGALLQLAASGMHSNTQLKEDDPGHNDYVIDELVAKSWYFKGFYENALAKDREVLADVEAAAFPSEEEKDLAVAGIYQDLAKAYDKQHQYAETIAYEEAALALGGSSDEEHFICFGYYRLKDYENALRTCGRAIDDEPGNLKAYYWRGQVYGDMGRSDDERRDLTVVADSEDTFRTSAAIDLSMIHFNRNDVRGALDVLNKYSYMYDPNLSNKSDIAVSYNNRCYAYMQLGELKKALDDCRASLRYGSLPDAYRKQEELINRVGASRGDL